MPLLSDNYYQRKCYLETDTVPTQSVMVKKMTPPLAKVYFKSMNRKLKVLAGLEPPMKGGGNDWYVPPAEMLNGRVVMKPVQHEHLKKLGFNGMVLIGEELAVQHQKEMEAEKRKTILDSDTNWKKTIEASCQQQWEVTSKEAAQENTSAIRQCWNEFKTMYKSSVNKIERLLFDAAIKEIQIMREKAFEKMKAQYEKLLNDQATMLYDRYTDKLNDEKARLKAKFIKNVEETRTKLGNQFHDINVEKHIAIEKLRQLQESMNLACQVYVTLKEREECQKEMELSQHKQQKTVKALKHKVAVKDFEIQFALKKEKRREEFNTIWKKKICAVVKKFQMFALYCLRELPGHADFFIDMEKLMMIQLSEAVENPRAESIFVSDEPLFNTPVPRPHPFYLFCDKGYKPQLDQDLCPKHCTSSASQFPVVVINKRYLYAACDNFEKFTDKIMDFIHGHRGEDIVFEDNHIYEHDVPVTITKSQQLLELKLQSSIMQVLQKELPNVNELPIECCVCHTPYCFCSAHHASQTSNDLNFTALQTSSFHLPPRNFGKMVDSRSAALVHEREPKWESYMDYVMPAQCRCGKRAKKHLEDHLPAYMRNTSIFQQPSLPNYETCPLPTLKRMVKKAQGRLSTPSLAERVESKTRDISTQYSDQNFDYLCTCFSDEEANKLFYQLVKKESATEPNQFKLVGDDVPSTHLSRRADSFALECAHSLRKLLNDTPQLEEIFKQDACRYD